MPTTKKFEEIARQQEDLVRSLAGKGPALPGMDLARLEATRQSLIRKRARAAARTYPQMAAALGADFSILFSHFAAEVPLPPEGGALADGRAFAEHLRIRNQLPEAAREEILHVDLRWRMTKTGLKRRRGFFFRLARLTHPRSLVLAIHLPFLGGFWVSWRG